MKLKYSFCRLAFFVILAGIGLTASGCGDDGPVGPITPKEQVVYFANQNPPYEFYCYHISSGKLDTFFLPYVNNGSWLSLAVSLDGRWMYLPSGTSIAIVDLRTRQIVKRYPAPGSSGVMEFGLSPDGRYLGVTRLGEPNQRGLWIIRANDGDVIFHDSVSSSHGIFSDNSGRYYCVAFDSLGHLYAYTLNLDRAFAISRTYFPNGAAWRILPNKAESIWGAFLWIFNDIFLFELYDPKADSVLYSQSMIPGFGEMVFSKDEKYIIYSQPGRLNSDVPIPDYFTIFNVENMQVEHQVHIAHDSLHPFHYISELYVTPNGQHLIGIVWVGGTFFDFNMETMQIERLVYIGNTQSLVGLTGAGKP